jgi:tetratricopeptide (TPR) repeat protein
MRISLTSRARKSAFLAISIFFATIIAAAASAEFIADEFFNREGLWNLQRSVQLQPGNAEYFDRLGDYTLKMDFASDKAIAAFTTAVKLNPHNSRYWLDLAVAHGIEGETDQEQSAVEHAIAVDPHSPQVAWQAAGIYAVRGNTSAALQQIRTVLLGAPPLVLPALALMWRLSPDVESDLNRVVPADTTVYNELLDLLMRKKDAAAARQTWSALVGLGQSVAAQTVFNYVHFLINESDVRQAQEVWQQAGLLSGLSAYQPTARNLIVNGDFDLDVLNGGFDWLYDRRADVNLALDPTDAVQGKRSLEIKFDSRGIEDAGIRQLVPVEPSSEYSFSAFYKADEMEGAGGPRILIQDAYDHDILFASDLMRQADSWTSVTGAFATEPQTKLLVIRVQRIPVDRPIRGKLWIDNLRLIGESQ